MPVKPTHPWNIFMLTDGAIGNTEDVVKLIDWNSHTSRLHTFGIGSGASSYLVKETARAGKGKSYLVPDQDPSLNSKVIQTLKTACKPAFTSLKIDWGVDSSALQF